MGVTAEGGGFVRLIQSGERRALGPIWGGKSGIEEGGRRVSGDMLRSNAINTGLEIQVCTA